MKIQLKITLLFTLLCLSVIIMLSTAFIILQTKRHSKTFIQDLELRAVIASRVNFGVGGDSSQQNKLDIQNQQAYDNLRRQHLQRLPEEEEFIMRTDTLDRVQALPCIKTSAADSSGRPPKWKSLHPPPVPVLYGHYPRDTAGELLHHRHGSTQLCPEFSTNLQRILVTVCIVSAVVLFSIGLLFSRQVLSPIRNIAKRVTNISVTSLHERLEVRGKDEVSLWPPRSMTCSPGWRPPLRPKIILSVMRHMS